jgi:hypothetical protein
VKTVEKVNPVTTIPVKSVSQEGTGEKSQMLATACGPDQKCQCIINAIITHESGWGTKGIAPRSNNPCGLRVPRSWTPDGLTGATAGAVGHFATFQSLQHGVNACAETYKRFYSEVSASRLMNAWVHGGGNPHYRSAVAACYPSS